MIKMEWEKAKEIEIWINGAKMNPRRPNTVLKDVDYKFINSGVLISGIEEGKIDFIPNHKIQQVRITP